MECETWDRTCSCLGWENKTFVFAENLLWPIKGPPNGTPKGFLLNTLGVMVEGGCSRS